MFRFDGAGDQGLPEWLLEAIKKDRKSCLTASAVWKSLAFRLAAFALIYFYLKERFQIWF